MLKHYMLSMALDGAEIFTGENKPPLVGETLEKIANEYILAEAVIERMSQAIDNHVMHALLRQPDVDLSSKQATEDSASRVAARVKDIKIVAEYDEIHERYRLKIMRMSHGNVLTSYLDNDFLESGDYAQIQKTAQVFEGLLSQGAYIQRGERKQIVAEFKLALEWLLEEAKKGLNVQRYKGLGEMNPSQLWETTMDPANRRLLRAQIEDSILTDEIFTTLMGDVVEPRRAFIEKNALRATNIDI